MTVESIRKHGVRLLNPFRGVMNIIEFEGAEAVTIDGINWDIYVKDMSLLTGINNPQSALITEIRFGHWSKKDGLTRGSIYPSEDFDTMEKQGYAVYEYLKIHANEAPFPLTDFYELWLLDEKNNPLALIASTYSKEKLHNDHVLQWTAGNVCKYFFKTIAEDTDKKYPFWLEDKIREATGVNPSAQWFERLPQHTTGLTGINIDSSLVNRTLNNKIFPEHYVQAFKEISNDILDTYVESLAPFLLTLPSLDKNQRQLLEQKARSQALFVDKLFLLYPEICDQKHIKAARVEAKLRKNQAVIKDTDDPLSPEYIELGISRTN